jgi:cell wall-associated NlpC family hydrolase
MRERARLKARERELGQRREHAATEQREAAEQHVGRAEAAEQRARIAAEEARRERAEADLRKERAGLHERGLADHELIEDHERERFAGTSAAPEDGAAAQNADRAGTEAPVEAER